MPLRRLYLTHTHTHETFNNYRHYHIDLHRGIKIGLSDPFLRSCQKINANVSVGPSSFCSLVEDSEGSFS